MNWNIHPKFLIKSQRIAFLERYLDASYCNPTHLELNNMETTFGRVDKVKGVASTTSKSIYCNLIKRIQMPSTTQFFMQYLHYFRVEKNIERLKYRVSPDPRMRAMQYEILKRIT